MQPDISDCQRVEFKETCGDLWQITRSCDTHINFSVVLMQRQPGEARRSRLGPHGRPWCMELAQTQLNEILAAFDFMFGMDWMNDDGNEDSESNEDSSESNEDSSIDGGIYVMPQNSDSGYSDEEDNAQ